VREQLGRAHSYAEVVSRQKGELEKAHEKLKPALQSMINDTTGQVDELRGRLVTLREEAAAVVGAPAAKGAEGGQSDGEETSAGTDAHPLAALDAQLSQALSLLAASTTEAAGATAQPQPPPTVTLFERRPEGGADAETLASSVRTSSPSAVGGPAELVERVSVAHALHAGMLSSQVEVSSALSSEQLRRAEEAKAGEAAKASASDAQCRSWQERAEKAETASAQAAKAAKALQGEIFRTREELKATKTERDSAQAAREKTESELQRATNAIAAAGATAAVAQSESERLTAALEAVHAALKEETKRREDAEAAASAEVEAKSALQGKAREELAKAIETARAELVAEHEAVLEELRRQHEKALSSRAEEVKAKAEDEAASAREAHTAFLATLSNEGQEALNELRDARLFLRRERVGKLLGYAPVHPADRSRSPCSPSRRPRRSRRRLGGVCSAGSGSSNSPSPNAEMPAFESAVAQAAEVQ
jgi:hypothetical protein